MGGGATWRLGAVAVVVASACADPVFDPIPDSDLHFSVFGVLDATADTQWIRVSPLRASITHSGEVLDAVVTLEHLGTGEVIELSDSLVSFESSLDDGTSVVRQNFWTDHPIEAGATYRLAVTRADGAAATATVPIAEAFDEVVVGIINNAPSRGFVRVPEAEHMAIVHVRHHYAAGCDDPEGFHAVPQLIGDEVGRPAQVSTAVEERFLACSRDVLRLVNPELYIVASGAQWPRGVEFASSALGVLDLPTNVEDGIGFLGGVFTRLIPWETCSFQNPLSGSAICELSYSSRSATLEGVVHDAHCDRPLDDAIVELTEIPEDPAVDPRVRRVSTKAGGRFRIGALDPGIPHVRRVSHPDRWPPLPQQPMFDVYQVRIDTVQFENGEMATTRFDLPRNVGPTGIPFGFVCDA